MKCFWLLLVLSMSVVADELTSSEVTSIPTTFCGKPLATTLGVVCAKYQPFEEYRSDATKGNKPILI